MKRLSEKEFKVTVNIDNLRRKYTNAVIAKPNGYTAGKLFLLSIMESEWIYETSNDEHRLTELFKYEERIDEVIEEIYDSEATTIGIVNQLRKVADKIK